MSNGDADELVQRSRSLMSNEPHTMIQYLRSVIDSFSLPPVPLSFLLSTFRARAIQILVLIFVGLVSRLIALLSPVGMHILIDDILPSNSYDGLGALVSILAIAYAIGIALSFTHLRIMTLLLTEIIVELFARLFRHIVRLDNSAVGKRSIGAYVQRFNELEYANSSTLSPILSASIELPFLVIAASIALSYSGSLFLVLLGQIGLSGLVAILFQPSIRRSVLKQLEQKELTDTLLVEAVSGHETIKVLTAEKRFEHLFDDGISATARTGIETSDLNNLSMHLRAAISDTGSLVVLGLGAYFVLNEAITLGAFVAFALVSRHIVEPATRLVNLLPAAQALQGTLTRLNEIILPDAETYSSSASIVIPDNRGPPAIVLEQVSIQVPDTSRKLFEELSLSFPPGTLTVLEGASGSGKSSLLRSIVGLRRITAGTIKIDDAHSTNMSVDKWRGLFATSFQPAHLFSLSIAENILLASKETNAAQFAELVGANEFISSIENNYSHILLAGGAKLSAGERQLISLARAFAAKDRPILLLDEPFAGLDQRAAMKVSEAIANRRRQQTIIVVSGHDLIRSIADSVVDLT